MELAMELRRGVDSDEEYVDRVLQRFNVEPYTYTLQPGRLSGRDTIDQFLFESLRGFCEHYASAFVFMMRAAGVPARVVAGYQGGEINPVNKTVIVHQFDAHAWAEVWFEGQGWVRVDPTAAVSPDRIELGLEEAMAAEGSFLSAAPLSILRYRNIPLLNLLRLRYDALTYRWQSWVVGFDRDQQFDLLHDLFGEISSRLFATLLLGRWVLVLLPVGISLLLRRKTNPISPLDKYYQRFCARMANIGIAREPGETPCQFAERISGILPGHSDEVWEVTALYNQLAYADFDSRGNTTTDALRKFGRVVNGLKPSRRRGEAGDTLKG